jgi:hypothetical protein
MMLDGAALFLPFRSHRGETKSYDSTRNLLKALECGCGIKRRVDFLYV